MWVYLCLSSPDFVTSEEQRHLLTQSNMRRCPAVLCCGKESKHVVRDSSQEKGKASKFQVYVTFLLQVSSDPNEVTSIRSK